MDTPVARVGSNLTENNSKGHLPFTAIGQTSHAPPGGVTLGGKYFRGGQFIPNADLEKASPEELKKLEQAVKISKIYGPKQAKKILQSLQYSPPAKREAVRNNTNGYNKLYYVDDGSVVGKPAAYGSLVIRNNPESTPILVPKELKWLTHMGTQKFDVIVSAEQLVYSFSGSFAAANIEIKGDTQNIFHDLTTIPGLTVSKIPIKEYTLLNNLDKNTQSALLPPNSAAVQPNLDSAGQLSSPELTTQEQQTTINPEVSSVNLLSPIGREQFSNLRLGDRSWLINENGTYKVYKLSNKQDTKKQLFVHKIYNALKVPTINLAPTEREDAVESDYEGASAPLNTDDKEAMSKVLKHLIVDVLLNNCRVLDKMVEHILDVNGEVVRSNFNADFDNDCTDDDLIKKAKENSDKGLLDKITPDLIDKLLGEAEYPNNQREIVKTILLKRLDKLK